MKRDKELEEAVAKLLTLKGYKFWRTDNYRCFKCGQVQNPRAKGMPDFVVWWPRTLFIECKTGTGRLTFEQQKVFEKTMDHYFIVYSTVDDLIKYLDL